MSVEIIGTPLPLVWECPWCHSPNPRANAGEDHCWDCGAVVLTAPGAGAALRVARTAGPPEFVLPDSLMINFMEHNVMSQDALLWFDSMCSDFFFLNRYRKQNEKIRR